MEHTARFASRRTPPASRLRSGRRLADEWELLRDRRARVLAAFALGAIVAGGALHMIGYATAGDSVWRVAVAVLAAELTVEVFRTIVVDRHMGVDTIALLAMVGALALGEELAGVVVGLMFSGGAALEEIASARARRELTALVRRAPRTARLRLGGRIEQVPVETVQVGAVVVVRTGEVIPIDGTLESEEAVIDTSALTGEPLPVTVRAGASVLSGTVNGGEPFDVRAQRPAVDSAYAALVRLVEQAESDRAPFVRMADRYAGFFLPATLLVAGAAWALSGDAVRALAVVVVATPCPLILAAPIAFVAGLSRAASKGVIVKGAGAIETLGRARTILFDKTGTLTVGTPEVRDVISVGGRAPEELLRLAASVDQLSAHVLGAALVSAATEAGQMLDVATEVREDPGDGIEGVVDGCHVAVGSRRFLGRAGIADAEVDAAVTSSSWRSGEAHVLIGVDGHLGGVIVMADALRPDAARIVERLRREGVRHVAMVSGDRRSVADRVGRELGVDRVYAEQTPAEKLEVVRSVQAREDLRPVVMVGDGVNDAPALALADLGIAMGAAGATVSSETADAVITVDRIDRVADAVHVGRRSVAIARQSVVAGMALSIVAMGVAALGYLPPIAGALLQEGIDLAVIVNALRALRDR